MPEYDTHYERIERSLRELLQKVMHQLTTKDLAEASAFLAAREYGLALETIASSLVERHEGINPAIVEQVDDLAGSMHLTGRPFVKEVLANTSR